MSIRKCADAEKELFRVAKEKELDSWLSADAIIPVLKAGISPSRIMKMRWVLTWKDPPEESGD